MSVLEMILVERHCNWEFPHAVLQVSLGFAIFHILTPSEVQNSSVFELMMPVSPLSPGGKTGVKETYLPAPQSVQDVAPSVAENLPATQSVHTAEPEPALYFPAVHNTHVAPSDPVAPGLQVQSVMESDC